MANDLIRDLWIRAQAGKQAAGMETADPSLDFLALAQERGIEPSTEIITSPEQAMQELAPFIQPTQETSMPLMTDSFIQTGSGNGGWFGVIQQGLGLAGQLLAPQNFPQPGRGGAITTEQAIEQGMPIRANVGGNCWVESTDPFKARRNFLRRRVRFVRTPGGGIQMVQTCAPRRMNPLNPRALARAGRRVASFTRIAQGMQKMLEKACRKGARGSRRSYSRSCAPKRCR